MFYLKNFHLFQSHKNVLYFALKALVCYLSHLDLSSKWNWFLCIEWDGGQHSYFFSLDMPLTQHHLLEGSFFLCFPAMASLSQTRCPEICESVHTDLFYSSPQLFVRVGALDSGLAQLKTRVAQQRPGPRLAQRWETSGIGAKPVGFVVWQIGVWVFAVWLWMSWLTSLSLFPNK